MRGKCDACTVHIRLNIWCRAERWTERTRLNFTALCIKHVFVSLTLQYSHMCLYVSEWIFAGYNNTNMDFAKAHMLSYLSLSLLSQSLRDLRSRFKKTVRWKCVIGSCVRTFIIWITTKNTKWINKLYVFCYCWWQNQKGSYHSLSTHWWAIKLHSFFCGK